MIPAAFLFDLDGTLVDTESVWCEAIVNWLADKGASATVEALLPVVTGRSWIDIDNHLHASFPIPKQPATEDAKELRAYYNRLVTDPAKIVIPSAVAFFKKAAKIAPCVIVSGSPHDDVLAAARLCGIDKLLAGVFGAEDYGRGKPAPDGFLAAAKALDVDASECVVVEDSTAGVAAGRAAGMRVIGVNRQTVLPQNLAGCEWLVSDLSEIDLEALFS